MTSPAHKDTVDFDSYEFRDRCQVDIDYYARHCFNFYATPQQKELFDAVVNNHMVAVRSGKGPGKTAGLSVVIWWWMTIHRECLIVCTATKESQLKKQLWRELRSRLNNAHPYIQATFQVNQLTAFAKGNPEGCQAIAQVAAIGNEEAMAGWHHENLLLIADEASGIPDTHLEALESTLTEDNNKMIMTSNPTKPSGFFFRAFHKAKKLWARLHFDCLDSPRVTQRAIKRILEQYGENSPMYRVQIRGEFPDFDADTLIPFAWVDKAVERYQLLEADFKGKIIIGVDPGRSVDRDASAFVARLDDHILDMEQHWNPDSMKIVGLARAFRDRICAEYPQSEFGGFAVDTIGLGGPIHDRLKELEEKTHDVNTALPPKNPKHFRDNGKAEPANLRAELWLHIREWLNRDGQINNEHVLADDLKMELASPKYSINSSGQILLESKDHMKNRGINSPNLADSVALTFFPVVSGGSLWATYI